MSVIAVCGLWCKMMLGGCTGHWRCGDLTSVTSGGESWRRQSYHLISQLWSHFNLLKYHHIIVPVTSTGNLSEPAETDPAMSESEIELTTLATNDRWDVSDLDLFKLNLHTIIISVWGWGELLEFLDWFWYKTWKRRKRMTLVCHIQKIFVEKIVIICKERMKSIFLRKVKKKI